MINKNFKQDWQRYNGEITVIDCKHFSFDIDKDWLGVGFDISLGFRMIYIKILCLAIRFY